MDKVEVETQVDEPYDPKGFFTDWIFTFPEGVTIEKAGSVKEVFKSFNDKLKERMLYFRLSSPVCMYFNGEPITGNEITFEREGGK